MQSGCISNGWLAGPQGGGYKSLKGVPVGHDGHFQQAVGNQTQHG